MEVKELERLPDQIQALKNQIKAMQVELQMLGRVVNDVQEGTTLRATEVQAMKAMAQDYIACNPHMFPNHKPANAGKAWTMGDEAVVVREVNNVVRDLQKRLGRSELSIIMRIAQLSRQGRTLLGESI